MNKVINRAKRVKEKSSKSSLWLACSIVSMTTLLLIVAAGVSRALSVAEPGTLDDTFGVGGKVLTTFAQFDETGTSVALQGDKIIAAGSTTAPGGKMNFGLIRYTPDGIVDSSFGNGGGVITDFGGGGDKITGDIITDLIVLADGRVIAGGRTNAPNGDLNFALVRYTPDGVVDPTFGNSTRFPGTMITHFRQVINTDSSARNSNELITAMALQSDGKVVAAGFTDSPQGDPNFALIRYNIDGTIDLTFGNPTGQPDQNPGRVITDFRSCTTKEGTVFRSTDLIGGIAIQGDDKIVAVGSSNSPFTGPNCTSDNNFAVVRYNADGTLDPTWGVSTLDPSRVITNFRTRPDPENPGSVRGFDDRATDVVIQGDGKIVVVGFSNAPTGQEQNFAAVRYNPDGTIDPTFNPAGTIDPTFSDNTIFPGTTLNNFDQCSRSTLPDSTTGEVFRSTDTAKAAAIQANGQIVVAGTSNAPLGDTECGERSDLNFALLRYSANGVPDTGFGPPNNRALTDLEITQAPLVNSSDDEARDVIIQPDGRIIAVGTSTAPFANNNTNFALTRYFP